MHVPHSSPTTDLSPEDGRAGTATEDGGFPTQPGPSVGGFWRAPIRSLSYPPAAVSSANEAAYLIDSRQRPDAADKYDSQHAAEHTSGSQ